MSVNQNENWALQNNIICEKCQLSPGAILGGEGVGTARGIPILLLLFSRPPLPPLLPLRHRETIGLQRAIKETSMHCHKFTKWHPLLSPSKKSFMTPSRPYVTWIWRINVINQRLRNSLLLFLTLFAFSFPHWITSPLGKQCQWWIKFMRKRRRLPDSLYLYLNLAIELKKIANEFL